MRGDRGRFPEIASEHRSIGETVTRLRSRFRHTCSTLGAPNLPHMLALASRCALCVQPKENARSVGSRLCDGAQRGVCSEHTEPDTKTLRQCAACERRGGGADRVRVSS